MQRCQPVFVLGCHISAVLDEGTVQDPDDPSRMPNAADSMRLCSALPRRRHAQQGIMQFPHVPLGKPDATALTRP